MSYALPDAHPASGLAGAGLMGLFRFLLAALVVLFHFGGLSCIWIGDFSKHVKEAKGWKIPRSTVVKYVEESSVTQAICSRVDDPQR